MSNGRRPRWIWALVSAALIVGTPLAGSLAALLLDTLVRRSSETGSITTMFPGFVYATATIMKVGLATGLASALIGLGGRVAARFAPPPADGPQPGASRLPVWALASLAIIPSTILVGTLTILVAQSVPALPTRAVLDGISRTGVLVMLVLLVAGAAAATVALVRRERPRLVAALGLVSSLALIALFWHIRFYEPGFDQDTWAPR